MTRATQERIVRRVMNSIELPYGAFWYPHNGMVIVSSWPRHVRLQIQATDLLREDARSHVEELIQAALLARALNGGAA